MIGKTVRYKSDNYNDNRTQYGSGEVVDKIRIENTDYYLIKDLEQGIQKVRCDFITVSYTHLTLPTKA